MGDELPAVDDLRAALERCRDRIETIPGILGSGVGLSNAGHPVIQVFVAADSKPQLIEELRGIVPGDFEVIRQEGPADG